MAEFETLFISGDRASQPAAAAADQKFYMVTDEDNIVERSDGIAWTQWGPSPASSGGGLILVEKKLLVAHATTVTFSGLDGDTHELYRLIARMVNSSGNTTGYVWRPNGETTNLSSKFSYINATDQTPSTLQLSGDTQDITNGSYWYFTIDIIAKKDPNAIAMPRYYTGTAGNGAASALLQGKWNETATNLTSIVIVAADTDGIGNGSTFALYRYAQS